MKSTRGPWNAGGRHVLGEDRVGSLSNEMWLSVAGSGSEPRRLESAENLKRT